MTSSPIITFKAGLCELDESSKPFKVSPRPEPGFIALYKEDDLHHFTWRPRSVPLSDAELDLLMFPGDGTFLPYHGPASPSNPQPITNGRIYVLRFSSSSSRHLFWLQSKSQSPSSDPSWFSPRDRKLGQIVNDLLQGEDVNVSRELASVPSRPSDEDDDELMEDADNAGLDLDRAASGGAGADATGGDFREEGNEAREGGADGGRAAAPSAHDAQAAVANFLQSLQGKRLAGSHTSDEKPYAALPDLLSVTTTLPACASADDSQLDRLLRHLPPSLLLSQEGNEISATTPDADTVDGILMSMSSEQKHSILEKVLPSPQFHQSLASLTMAVRDGGLPSIAEALDIKVANGGYIKKNGAPLSGGQAMEAFINGVRSSIEEENNADPMDLADI